ncbi:MAG TPA: hypothetical protein VK942_10655 [Actinomycetes bacterium]|nr:hypothetical protein [Actinomycetes bacterium]
MTRRFGSWRGDTLAGLLTAARLHRHPDARKLATCWPTVVYLEAESVDDAWSFWTC